MAASLKPAVVAEQWVQNSTLEPGVVRVFDGGDFRYSHKFVTEHFDVACQEMISQALTLQGQALLAIPGTAGVHSGGFIVKTSQHGVYREFYLTELHVNNVSLDVKSHAHWNSGRHWTISVTGSYRGLVVNWPEGVLPHDVPRFGDDTVLNDFKAELMSKV